MVSIKPSAFIAVALSSLIASLLLMMLQRKQNKVLWIRLLIIFFAFWCIPRTGFWVGAWGADNPGQWLADWRKVWILWIMWQLLFVNIWLGCIVPIWINKLPTQAIGLILPRFRWLLKGLLIGIGLAVMTMPIPDQHQQSRIQFDIYYLIMLLTTFLYAAQEEQIFRGFMMGILMQDGLSIEKALWIQAVLFGIIHVPVTGTLHIKGVWDLIVLVRRALVPMMIGLLYGYLRTRWGLAPCIVAHSVANAILKTVMGLAL